MKLLSHPIKLFLFSPHKYPTILAKLNAYNILIKPTETDLRQKICTMILFIKKGAAEMPER